MLFHLATNILKKMEIYMSILGFISMFTMSRNTLNLHCQMLSRQSYFYCLESPALNRISKYFVESATNYSYIQSRQSTLSKRTIQDSSSSLFFVWNQLTKKINYFLGENTESAAKNTIIQPIVIGVLKITYSFSKVNPETIFISCIWGHRT